MVRQHRSTGWRLVAQLVCIPERTYHHLPGSGATFVFTSPLFVPVSPHDIAAAEIREVQRPNRFFADSDAGAQLSAFWKGWDLTANYFYHFGRPRPRSGSLPSRTGRRTF